jgi:hypothetical protein
MAAEVIGRGVGPRPGAEGPAATRLRSTGGAADEGSAVKRQFLAWRFGRFRRGSCIGPACLSAPPAITERRVGVDGAMVERNDLRPTASTCSATSQRCARAMCWGTSSWARWPRAAVASKQHVGPRCGGLLHQLREVLVLPTEAVVPVRGRQPQARNHRGLVGPVHRWLLRVLARPRRVCGSHPPV